MEPQEEKLRQEILADAKKRADRIIARAKSDAANAEKAAAAANEKLRQERLAAAQEESDVRHRSIIQGLWSEKRKLWLVAREECLDALFAEVRQEAVAIPVDDPRHGQSLARLIAEGIASVDAPEVVLQVTEADAKLVTPAWLQKNLPEEFAAVKISVQCDKAIRGGVKISSADGRRNFDNTYGGRLHRLHESFREEIARALPSSAI